MRINRINEIERKYSERTQPVTNDRVEGVKDNYKQFQEHLHREMTDKGKNKKKHVIKKDTFELFAERNRRIKKGSKLKPRYFRG